MSENITLASGLAGIRTGLDGMQKTAGQIASKDAMQADNPGQMAASLVDLKVHQHQVGASVQVIKAVDEMIGTLLDVKA